GIAVPFGFALAVVSALPVARPWEYYNELIGGSSNAYRYFMDDGLDSLAYLRGLEMARYYHEQLEPKGDVPYVLQGMPQQEMQRRGIRWVDTLRDRERFDADIWSGTIIAGPITVAPKLWWDRPW